MILKYFVVLTGLLSFVGSYRHAFNPSPSYSKSHLQGNKRFANNQNEGGGQGSSNRGQLSKDVLPQIIVGQMPSTFSSSRRKPKVPKSERVELEQKRLSRLAELVSGPVSRFVGKHLFENGVFKGKIDSFEALTKDPSIAKTYLVELNRKLYKGGILPHNPNNIQNWINKMDRTSLTIIDTDLDALVKDIKPKFENWKNTEIEKNGQLPNRKDKISQWSNFKTEAKYKVTHFTFEPIKNAQGDIIAVSVKAEQFNTRVDLGTDENGNPSHFEKMHPADISNPVNKLREKSSVTRFTIEELGENAKITSSFWKDIGVPGKKKNIILNEKAKIFQQFKEQNDADLESKVIKSSSSRKQLNPNEEVETIHPKEFFEKYKKADGKEKTQLADLARQNLDKLVGIDNSEQEKIRKLIQLEDMKSHVNSVEIVTQVQSSKFGKATGAFEREVDFLKNKISSVKSKVKLSTSKISAKYAHLSNSKFAKGGGAVSKYLGMYFLGKTIVNGIKNGDTTSLAIVGASVGPSVVTKTAEWAGAKYFSAASKIGKSTEILGKVAGPLGALGDAGLSVWSLTKSVGRLRSAKNQYERNDAIIDIVSDSVGLAITATVTGLSIIFAPLAPLIIAVGVVIDLLHQLATAIFKSANEVSRINAEIPLLDSEKDYVFKSRLFDWFGTRQKDYLEYLMEEKQANDLAVQHNLKFLQENPSFLGVVFPSRTLAYDGGCHLTKRYCAVKNAWGCTTWGGNAYTVGSGCDLNRQCNGRGICTDYWTSTGFWTYDDFKCICDKPSETSFGDARRNSLVDFRQKQNLYWERAVPKDVEGAEFKCKPGSTTFQDDKLHEMSSRWEILCENAIALLQPSSKRNGSQTMLFDLVDGHDQVYLSSDDPTPNLFRVGEEGTKEFFGGGGKNEFLFDGKCTQSLKGTLTGGASYSDVVTILETCKRGEYINMNFKDETLTSRDGYLNMKIKNVEEFNGRKNEGDNILAGCQLRKVMLGGGNARQHDIIKIANNQCSYNLTVIAGSFMNIKSETRQGEISMVAKKEWKAVNISLDIYPKNSLKLSVFFLSTSSYEVKLVSVTNQEELLLVTLGEMQTNNEMRLRLNFQAISNPDDRNQPIYFSESPPGVPYSVLQLSFSSPVFYHTLPEIKAKTGLTRLGNINIENFFEITGDNWTVVGGEKSDEFILQSKHVIMLDGQGGDDILRLHPNLKKYMVINLSDDRKFKSIESMYGVPGIPVDVTCACESKLVAPLGGSEIQPDLILIPAGTCKKRDLQIVVKGHSHVVVSTDMGNATEDKITLVVVASDKFELETKSSSLAGMFVAIQTSHKNWTTYPGVWASDRKSAAINLSGNGSEKINLKIDSIKNADDPYLSTPFIQVAISDSNEPSGLLVIERETLMPKMLYHLTIENAMKNGSNINVIEGFKGIPNMFRIISGSWHVNGGNSSDIFTISSSAQTQTILSVNGGNGGENTLILENDNLSPQNQTYGINLETGKMGPLKQLTKGNVTNIHHVLGRIGLPDAIHTGCNTKSVSGREGAGKGQEDLIFISGNGCPKYPQSETIIFTEKFSKVLNQAEAGLFTYIVPDLLTAELELKATLNNTHHIKFGFNPWKHITKISFDDTTNTLGIKVGQDGNEREQFFQMYRKNESEEYSNPIFEFHEPGTQVTSDIRVGADTILAATIVIHREGLKTGEEVRGIPVDVNRFLINITEPKGVAASGSIKGSPTTSANQFWIFQVANALEMIDGVACSAFFPCTNYLHFDDTFESGKNLELYMGGDEGFIKSGNETVVSKLINMHEIVGRSGEQAPDKLIVSTCDVKKILGMEEIVIIHIAENDCAYDLIMEIDRNTTVCFENLETTNSSSIWLNSTFHYRFIEPGSFDPTGNSEAAFIGPKHNYYLSFKVDDLESIWFDLENDQLHYALNGSEFFHSMITGTGYNDQFYTQPSLITADGFKIYAARDGSIMLGMGAGSSFSLETIRSKVIPAFEDVAKKLAVTVILQTDKQYIHLGHGNLEGNRNVLQNLGHSESHLVGGGADDTIYDIVELHEDVFIYTGFDVDFLLNWNDQDFENLTKQTLDLTDVVVPIRIQSGTKYVPKVSVENDDLVISMDGYAKEHPGKIYIVNGAINLISERIQLLLNSAIMDLISIEAKNIDKRSKRSVLNKNEHEWKIIPRPILVPDATVFSISNQDLENGHEIRVVENATESNSTFNAARNGTDLYLTNVMITAEMEITTIIIADFFEDAKFVLKAEAEYTEGFNQNITEPIPILPSMIFDVAVSLPGINLILNGSDVLAVNKVKSTSNKKEEGASTRVEMKPIEVRDWKFILYEAEEQILKDMPDIPRTFRCEECQKSSNWIVYLATFGCMLGLIIILVAVLPSIIRSRRRSGYQQI